MSVNLKTSHETLEGYYANVRQVAVSSWNVAIACAGRTVRVLAGVTEGASRVSKSPDALKYTLAGCVELANATHLFGKIILSKKTTDVAVTIQEVISAVRIVVSLDYFLNGKFRKDLTPHKIYTVAANVCFLAARIAVTALWAVKHNLVTLGKLSSIVGSTPGLRLLTHVSAGAFIQTLFAVGIALATVEVMHDIIEKKEVLRHSMDMVNLLAEFTLLALQTVAPPLALSVLGMVAATAGITSCVLKKTDKHIMADEKMAQAQDDLEEVVVPVRSALGLPAGDLIVAASR
ncbi:MAG: hypothetical protein JWO53_285 [Chlamydiia bacterium]|nr:hypothetical protein [Chlamydiia bacterium]